jgi:hypothetical protein
MRLFHVPFATDLPAAASQAQLPEKKVSWRLALAAMSNV